MRDSGLGSVFRIIHRNCDPVTGWIDVVFGCLKFFKKELKKAKRVIDAVKAMR